MSKSLNEILSSLCNTAGLEYEEREDVYGVVSESTGDKMVGTLPSWYCEILKDGEVVASNFSTIDGFRSIEEVKQTAREWLLYSLIIKAI